MPLKVVIAGAGISGLCTAVALHQNGHDVKIFEKSRFSQEVESSFLLTPNAIKVLLALGFDLTRARADDMTYFEVFDGTSLRSLNSTDGSLRDPRDEFGTALYTIHRNDLVNELLRLASGLDVRLGTTVLGVDEAESVVILENGERHKADLIVAGDGLHSVLRATVLRDEVVAAATPSGLNAFRFMIPTERLKDDEIFLRLQKDVKGKASCLFCDPTRIEMEHHIVWFTCRDREKQVFVGIHESERVNGQDLKTLMLEEFSHYHPDLKHIISVATDVTDWPLSYHEPLETWHRNNIVLTGDAAHPMLPLGAQGANQAIEDAGALHALFDGATTTSDIETRLTMYEKVRRLRASRVQTLSNVRLGREIDVVEKLKKFADPDGTPVPTSFAERYAHDYGFDVYAKCREVLDAGEKSKIAEVVVNGVEHDEEARPALANGHVEVPATLETNDQIVEQAPSTDADVYINAPVPEIEVTSTLDIEKNDYGIEVASVSNSSDSEHDAHKPDDNHAEQPEAYVNGTTTDKVSNILQKGLGESSSVIVDWHGRPVEFTITESGMVTSPAGEPIGFLDMNRLALFTGA